MTKTNGQMTITQAATELGISRQAVHKWIDKLNIKVKALNARLSLIKRKDVNRIARYRAHKNQMGKS